MAENESLDYGNPGASRWQGVCSDVRNGKSSDKIAHKVETKICAALRKTLKELKEKGVPLSEFIKNKDSPDNLRRLLRKSGNHEFAALFVDTATGNPEASTSEVLTSFIGGVWDRISDQIVNKVANNTEANLNTPRKLCDEVAGKITPEIERIADRLADNPDWKVTKSRKKGQRTDPTQEKMSESLL